MSRAKPTWHPTSRESRSEADRIDAEALERFRNSYPELKMAPVCVLIPAFQEEGSIAGVLNAVPSQVAELATTTVVVMDGCTDRTGEVAAAHGALLCMTEVNRGQGAALRLGYKLARETGARFIVTVDADGQWDPSEMERLVKPLCAGEADLVQGSRRLGWAANDDKFRALGVRVFSTIVNLLTGARITDSSSGFRAIKTEVVTDITLEQNQYQASELLIAVLARGFRVAERPVTMRARAAGTTKKGGNLAYGARYGSVILHTWLRERRRTR